MARSGSLAGTDLGPFRVVAELGSGGMGTVYAAVLTEPTAGLASGTRVALKVVHPHLLDSEVAHQRFLREASLGRRVEHPNVVRTYDARSIDANGARVDCLVMEHVEGQTLRSVLAEMGRVPEALCRHVGREVAGGLAAIHAVGAVHRDLKPENVLLTADHVVKVMDLGVARLADESARLSESGAFVGSVRYAAPEQFRGGAVDARADLHALGAMLHELATSVHPFDGTDFRAVMRSVLDVVPRRVSEIVPEISTFLDEVIARLLAKDPARRFASAAEVARVLAEGETSAWWESVRRSPGTAVSTRRRIQVPRETAVHGRDAEVARLLSLFERARAGEGQVVLVEGEAGVGKTRLLDEVAARLERDGAQFRLLFGAFASGGAATAHAAFAEAYRRHLGDADLEESLRAALPETPLLVPAFAAFLRGEAPPPGSLPLTRDSLQTLLVRLTGSLAAGRPAIVALDDVHFAPDEGRALFAALALGIPRQRVLLVGTFRPGVDEAWLAAVGRMDHASRLQLGRLGPRDLAALLAEALRSERLAEELGWLVARKSDGNPLFALEILRSLRESGRLVETPDGNWATAATIREVRIPSSIAELVNSRIAELTDDERRVLEAAACAGFDFDPLLVGEVLGLAQIPLLRTLAAVARKHRIVRADGRRYVFDHHQVHEALYTGMPELLREPLHAAIGAALEARAGGTVAGALAVEICDQHLRGGRGSAAMRHLDAALEHLQRSDLHEAAADLVRRVLGAEGLVAGTARAALLLRWCGGLDLLGRREEHARALDEVDALAAAAGDERLHLRSLVSRGWLYAQTGRSAEAGSILAVAAAMAHRLGDAAEEGRALGNLGNVHWSLGRYDEAFAAHTQSLEFARRSGDRHREAITLGNLGNVHWSLGRHDEAFEAHMRSLELAREDRDRRGEAITLGNLGAVRCVTGRTSEALDLLRPGLSLAQALGERRAEAFVRGNLGSVFSMLGRYEEAEDQFVRWGALALEVGERMWVALAASNRAAVLAARGRPDEARALVLGTLATLRSLGARAMVADALLELADLEFEAGRQEQAEAPAREALATARELGLAGAEIRALVHLARLPGGDVGAAEAALAANGNRLVHDVRMTVRFRMHRASGSREHLAEAARLLAAFVEHAPAEDRPHVVSRVRIYREIDEAARRAGLSAGPAR